jgi:high-affinity nickel-transport protein
VATELNLTGAFWGWLNNLDFETIGYGIIGIFLVTWLVSLAVWKIRRFDQQYTPKLSPTE